MRKDRLVQRLNDQFVARGMPHLVKPLPSERWKKTESIQPSTNTAHHAAPHVPTPTMPPTMSRPTAAASQAPFQFNTAAFASTITPSQGAPLCQPTTGGTITTQPFSFGTTSPASTCDATWTIKLGAYTIMHEEPLRRQLSFLRAFADFVASVPWDGYVTMQFKSQEDAENVAFMLKETFIKDEQKGPVPAFVTEPVKVSLKIEPPASPDPEGVNRKIDVTTTPGAISHKPSEDGKRTPDPATYVPSGHTPEPKNSRTDPNASLTTNDQAPDDTRVQRPEFTQEQHGKRLEDLSAKIEKTDQKISRVNDNVDNIANMNAIRDMQAHRNWHTFGKCDPAAKQHLRERVTGKISKLKTYYVLCTDNENRR